MKCLERVNLQGEKADEWLPRAGIGGENLLQINTIGLLGVEGCSKTGL